jgi:hypothetical protein
MALGKVRRARSAIVLTSCFYYFYSAAKRRTDDAIFARGTEHLKNGAVNQVWGDPWRLRIFGQIGHRGSKRRECKAVFRASLSGSAVPSVGEQACLRQSFRRPRLRDTALKTALHSRRLKRADTHAQRSLEQRVSRTGFVPGGWRISRPAGGEGVPRMVNCGKRRGKER